MITSKNWYERMGEDMVLKDFRPTTRDSYESAVRLFLAWAKAEPVVLSEELVRNYVLHLREEKKLSASSINIATCALRFFFTYTVPREWPIFELLRLRKSSAHERKRCPDVLREHEPLPKRWPQVINGAVLQRVAPGVLLHSCASARLRTTRLQIRSSRHCLLNPRNTAGLSAGDCGFTRLDAALCRGKGLSRRQAVVLHRGRNGQRRFLQGCWKLCNRMKSGFPRRDNKKEDRLLGEKH